MPLRTKPVSGEIPAKVAIRSESGGRIGDEVLVADVDDVDASPPERDADAHGGVEPHRGRLAGVEALHLAVVARDRLRSDLALPGVRHRARVADQVDRLDVEQRAPPEERPEGRDLRRVDDGGGTARLGEVGDQPAVQVDQLLGLGARLAARPPADPAAADERGQGGVEAQRLVAARDVPERLLQGRLPDGALDHRLAAAAPAAFGDPAPQEEPDLARAECTREAADRVAEEGRSAPAGAGQIDHSDRRTTEVVFARTRPSHPAPNACLPGLEKLARPAAGIISGTSTPEVSSVDQARVCQSRHR